MFKNYIDAFKAVAVAGLITGVAAGITREAKEPNDISLAPDNAQSQQLGIRTASGTDQWKQFNASSPKVILKTAGQQEPFEMRHDEIRVFKDAAGHDLVLMPETVYRLILNAKTSHVPNQKNSDYYKAWQENSDWSKVELQRILNMPAGTMQKIYFDDYIANGRTTDQRPYPGLVLIAKDVLKIVNDNVLNIGSYLTTSAAIQKHEHSLRPQQDTPLLFVISEHIKDKPITGSYIPTKPYLEAYQYKIKNEILMTCLAPGDNAMIDLSQTVMKATKNVDQFTNGQYNTCKPIPGP